MKRILSLTIVLMMLSFSLVATAVRADDIPSIPPTPADQTRFYAVYNSVGPTGEDGYWVWNYLYFAPLGDDYYAGHQWTPHWEWYGKRVIVAFKSLLSNPDAFQLEMMVYPQYESQVQEALKIAYETPAPTIQPLRDLGEFRWK